LIMRMFHIFADQYCDILCPPFEDTFTDVLILIGKGNCSTVNIY
jgi:hypothetical protein